MFLSFVQKAIKEKDIPIDGVEFMGPNKEKPDSWRGGNVGTETNNPILFALPFSAHAMEDLMPIPVII